MLAVGGWHPCRPARQAASNDGDIMANLHRGCQNKVKIENREWKNRRTVAENNTPPERAAEEITVSAEKRVQLSNHRSG